MSPDREIGPGFFMLKVVYFNLNDPLNIVFLSRPREVS